MKMIKSYKLKIFANKNKLSDLDSLVSFWQKEVNKKIELFWDLKDIKGSFPPKEYSGGGKLISDASNKAWQICKGAKKRDQEKPLFKGNEVDLNCYTMIFCDFTTKEFDFWIKVAHLKKGQRLTLPCKKTRIFNEALKTGQLKKSAQILKVKDGYYLQVYVEFEKQQVINTNKIGIDVGLNNPAVDSNEKTYGDAKELKDLRIRTKHRDYTRCVSPNKQILNRIAKEIISRNPNTDFVMEGLHFKGKGKRSKEFRRRNTNWSYMHLGRMLERHGNVEGFNVDFVNPAYTSQTCPICKYVARENRVGEKFRCLKCGYTNHSDIVGALNILGRVSGEYGSPQLR